jgi:heme/copper-type cytochrome/quinol oxidase subunit 1
MFERIFPYFFCSQVVIAVLLSAAAFIVHVIERNIRGKRFNRLPLWLAGAATTTLMIMCGVVWAFCRVW